MYNKEKHPLLALYKWETVCIMYNHYLIHFWKFVLSILYVRAISVNIPFKTTCTLDYKWFIGNSFNTCRQKHLQFSKIVKNVKDFLILIRSESLKATKKFSSKTPPTTIQPWIKYTITVTFCGPFTIGGMSQYVI